MKKMKSEKKIGIAFLLNLTFSVFELAGGMLTGSVAILSDAVHDFGDAAGIGLSWLLEKKSGRAPDESYTFGYARFSLLGSVITTMILLLGSVLVIAGALVRLVNPKEIHYGGMILFAVVGVAVNLCAALFTRDGESLNQRAVNLHMLEDVLGWAVVLAGAVVMKFTGFDRIDPLLSIGVAGFILIHAVRVLKESAELFLERVPRGIEIKELREHIAALDGVREVHHIHVWSMDGRLHCATLHAVTDGDGHEIKESIRNELREHGISHVTVETESVGELCRETHCHAGEEKVTAGCHHGHHH